MGGLAIAFILICGLYLATDSLRFRHYASQAERAARPEPNPVVPLSVATERHEPLSKNTNIADAWQWSFTF
jgi:hypothetical protein